jgi:hypothetical protein
MPKVELLLGSFMLYLVYLFAELREKIWLFGIDTFLQFSAK